MAERVPVGSAGGDLRMRPLRPPVLRSGRADPGACVPSHLQVVFARHRGEARAIPGRHRGCLATASRRRTVGRLTHRDPWRPYGQASQLASGPDPDGFRRCASGKRPAGRSERATDRKPCPRRGPERPARSAGHRGTSRSRDLPGIRLAGPFRGYAFGSRSAGRRESPRRGPAARHDPARSDGFTGARVGSLPRTHGGGDGVDVWA